MAEPRLSEVRPGRSSRSPHSAAMIGRPGTTCLGLEYFCFVGDALWSKSDAELIEFSIFKRSHDARKKSAIQLIYTIDCALRDEAAVLARLAGQPHIRPAPDTAYRLVARAKDGERRRPIVIGVGPCGLFAGLLLAQMGFRPIILERGKSVRERTQDTWRLWRQGRLEPVMVGKHPT